jgi:hypothetical protein
VSVLGDWLGLGRTAALALNVPSAGVLSPWGHDDSFLERVVVPDIWPDTVPRPMTRGEAMQVPAVSRSRHLICATIASLPLVALSGADPAGYQPQWCFVTDGQLGDLTPDQCERYGLAGGQSPFHRMLATADDLLFCGQSLWLVTRPIDRSGRLLPNRMVHIPYGSWQTDPQTGALVDQNGHPFCSGEHDQRADAETDCRVCGDLHPGETAETPADVVYIEGPHPGVLTFGAATIRAASTLELTAAEVARTPFRLGVHQTSEITLTPAERREIVAEVRQALADNGGILYTNSALELTEYRLDSSELLVGGRQAAALDVARHCNLPGAMIDAEPTGSSLTYSNPESRNQQWLDYGLASYLDAIGAALSMDNVVPTGQRVAFDTSSLTTTLAPTTGAPTPD